MENHLNCRKNYFYCSWLLFLHFSYNCSYIILHIYHIHTHNFSSSGEHFVSYLIVSAKFFPEARLAVNNVLILQKNYFSLVFYPSRE